MRIQASQQLWVGHRVRATRAEGPHRRAALWVSGCSIRCPGCCNPELFSREGGQALGLPELQAWIHLAQQKDEIEGVSVLGGEPLEQWEALVPWLGWLNARGLGVIVYTGYRWARVGEEPRYAALPELVDTLVDGPFVHTMPEPEKGRAVVGSTNQGLQHFSSRYEDPQLWRGPRRAHVEIQPDGQVRLHGAPALVAKIKKKLAAG